MGHSEAFNETKNMSDTDCFDRICSLIINDKEYTYAVRWKLLDFMRMVAND